MKTKPLNILMITPDYPPIFGGIGGHVHNLVNNLIHLNCHITVLVSRVKAPKTYTINGKKDIEIKEINPSLTIMEYFTSFKDIDHEIFQGHEELYNTTSLFELNLLHNNYEMCNKLLTHMRVDNDYDLIHLHNAYNALGACLLKNIIKKPLITTMHSASCPPFKLHDNLSRYILHNSDFITCVSHSIKVEAVKRYQLNQDNIDVVYNSVNPSNPGNTHIIDKDNPCITFCGRLDQFKGCDILYTHLHC